MQNSNRYTTSIDLKYSLTLDAPRICFPSKNLEDDTYTLRTRINFSLASGNIMEIPTGIVIPESPSLSINPRSAETINGYLIAVCSDYYPNLRDHGIKVLGPQAFKLGYPEELKVLIKNESNKIFRCEEGDEIASLSFLLKPHIEFTAI